MPVMTSDQSLRARLTSRLETLQQDLAPLAELCQLVDELEAERDQLRQQVEELRAERDQLKVERGLLLNALADRDITEEELNRRSRETGSSLAEFWKRMEHA